MGSIHLGRATSKEKGRIGQVMTLRRHCWRSAAWPGFRFAVPAGLIGALFCLAIAGS